MKRRRKGMREKRLFHDDERSLLGKKFLKRRWNVVKGAKRGFE